MVLKLEENKQNIFIFREGFTSLNRNPASVKLCRMYMHASMRSYNILTKHYKEFGYTRYPTLPLAECRSLHELKQENPVIYSLFVSSAKFPSKRKVFKGGNKAVSHEITSIPVLPF